jgi:hypothetical protein
VIRGVFTGLCILGRSASANVGAGSDKHTDSTAKSGATSANKETHHGLPTRGWITKGAKAETKCNKEGINSHGTVLSDKETLSSLLDVARDLLGLLTTSGLAENPDAQSNAQDNGATTGAQTADDAFPVGNGPNNRHRMHYTA